MRQFNYKCVVAKNGSKMYYKRVKGKWKRISNAIGMKVEKGRKKYSGGQIGQIAGFELGKNTEISGFELGKNTEISGFELGKNTEKGVRKYIVTMKKDTPVFRSLKYTRKKIDDTTLDKISAEKIKNSTLFDDTKDGYPIWFALKNNVYGYGKSNNGFVVWIKIPEKEDIDELNIESYKGKIMSGVCKIWGKRSKKYVARNFSYCKHLIPIYYKPEFGCGPFIEVKFHKDLKLINLSDIEFYKFLFNLKMEDLEKLLGKDYNENEVYLREKLCETFVDCTNNKYKISRKSDFTGDEKVVEELKKFFPDIDGYYYNNKEDTFHPEICVWKWPIKTTTKSIEECKHETISSPLIEALNIPTYDQFLKGEFPKNYNSKLYTKEEFKEIKKKKQGENHFILESGFLGE